MHMHMHAISTGHRAVTAAEQAGRSVRQMQAAQAGGGAAELADPLGDSWDLFLMQPIDRS